jgi:chemotaxis protein histidine kinase CheA
LILYDENYKFLGVEEGLLKRLGFNSIGDLNSVTDDFANLFEKDKSLIYNFENFSWIDFVLYGGSNRNSAVIKDKSGKKYSVKIYIEEIHLQNDFNGMNKLFSIKLPNLTNIESENIENINNQNDSKEEDSDDLSINLSFLKETAPTNKEDSKPSKESQKEIKTDLNFFKKESDQPQKEPQVESKNEDINLDFLKKDTTPTNKEDTKPSKESQKEIKTDLNFFKKESDQPQKEPQVESKNEDINLDFLKKDTTPTNKEDTKPSKESQKEIKTDLNFFKKESDQPQKEPQVQSKNEDINLDFLKKDTTPTNKEDTKPSKESEKEKKSDMIDKIKSEINEIDGISKKDTLNKNSDPLSSFDISNSDKKEIINDFINEAKFNIELIKNFMLKEDYGSINYSFIKISSSAQILNLVDISSKLLLLKKALLDRDTTKINTEIDHLSTTLEALKRYT